MRQPRDTRNAAFARATRDEVKDGRIIRPANQRIDTGIIVGSAMVVVARAWGGGKGAICEIEVLSNGIGSGIRYINAIAYYPATQGSIVSFCRRPDGSVEILAGGAGAGTGTTTTVTANNGNIYPSGWCVSGS